jgi:Tfp pilus assembly protein PilN
MASERSTFSIDFLPPEYRQRLQARREIRPRALLFGATVLAILGAHFWLGQELSRLRLTCNSLRETTAVQRKVQEKLEEAQKQLKLFEEQAVQWLTQENRRPVSQIIHALIVAKPPGVYWEEIHFRTEKTTSAGPATGVTNTPPDPKATPSGGPGGPESSRVKTSVTLVGWAAAAEDLNQYLAAITRSALFRRVELVGSQMGSSRKSQLRFEIRLEVSAPTPVLAVETSRRLMVPSPHPKG